jgi:hypothetical protein
VRVPLMRIRYKAIDTNKWTLSVWRQLTHTRVGWYAISAAMWRYDVGWRAKYFRFNPIFIIRICVTCCLTRTQPSRYSRTDCT